VAGTLRGAGPTSFRYFRAGWGDARRGGRSRHSRSAIATARGVHSRRERGAPRCGPHLSSAGQRQEPRDGNLGPDKTALPALSIDGRDVTPGPRGRAQSRDGHLRRRSRR